MPLPIEDVASKIKWANKHINDFMAAAVEFAKTDPYGTTVKTDPQSQQRIYTITKITPIPAHLRLIAGDAIQNMRSALDYLACGLVRVATKAEPSKYVGFPISDSEPLTKEEKAAFARQVKGMRQGTIDAIKAIKPYQRGNDTLWRLHRLNRIDKHRLLMAAGTSVALVNPGFHRELRDYVIRGSTEGIVPEAATQLRDRFPLKAGDTFSVDLTKPEMNDNPQFLLEIAFNEPGIAEGEVILTVLKESLRCVQDVVGNLSRFLY
ncbi:MAG: hypothetical protein ABSD76_13705 [Terriglobales bacterium]|jgi:hypothetical protein